MCRVKNVLVLQRLVGTRVCVCFFPMIYVAFFLIKEVLLKVSCRQSIYTLKIEHRWCFDNFIFGSSQKFFRKSCEKKKHKTNIITFIKFYVRFRVKFNFGLNKILYYKNVWYVYIWHHDDKGSVIGKGHLCRWTGMYVVLKR